MKERTLINKKLILQTREKEKTVRKTKTKQSILEDTFDGKINLSQEQETTPKH